MDISLPDRSATACAMLSVSGVRKADVSAPPVTPPESYARPTNSVGEYFIIAIDIA